ncbi:MAG: integration host factor subunit alpha [Roseovarius sp.]|nr:integration host factor subunit alpha [Roseovarius sp.]
MAVTRQDLVRTVSMKAGLSTSEAKQIVELMFSQVTAALEAGEDVKLSTFGSFQIRHSPKRMGRNPKTGDSAVISARRRVTFKPSKLLLERVDGLTRKDG